QTQRLTAFQTHGKVRFCPCRARQGQKSPHEPRSWWSNMLPRPPDSAQRRHKDADYESDQIDKMDVSQKGKICGTSLYMKTGRRMSVLFSEI
ncbi:MAG: hypothetical protein KIC46_03500, partial [Clostridiales bacterium]|nr:hypothetical protein [Clostridiales bacterium]